MEEMNRIEDGSVDMILADLPYGVLAHDWDIPIPFAPLWVQYERVIRSNGAIVLTATQPFTSSLIMSNIKLFKYCWVWDKGKPGNIYIAKLRPLQVHEDIAVFSKGTVANCSKKLMNYYPIMEKMDKPDSYRMSKQGRSFQREKVKSVLYQRDKKYPKTILRVPNNNQRNKLAPTQKPVALLSYLIKTYTNEGDLILDNTCGSGSALEAAMRCNRRSIGIEKDLGYYNVAAQRLERVAAELRGEYVPKAANGKIEDLPMFAGVDTM